MKSIVTTLTCMLVLLASSSAWGQPAQVSTLALNGTLDASGGMAMGPDGMLYVSNFVRDAFTFNPPDAGFGNKIYRVNPETGAVELFAEDTALRGPFGMAFDPDGNLLVTNLGFGSVSIISPDGVVGRFGDTGGLPTGITVGADSSVFIAVCPIPGEDGRILKYRPGSTSPTTMLEGNACPLGVAVDDQGNIYSSYNAGNILVTPPEGGSFGLLAPVTPGSSVLNHLVYSSADNALYTTALQDHRIYKVSLGDSSVNVLAGTGGTGAADGPAPLATFINPNGIVLSPDGNTLYVNQALNEDPPNPNSIRMITEVLGASPVANEDETEIPKGFILEQNYPNPFNPATHIRFTLAQTQEVTLEVYDLSGRKVATLLDGFRPAGAHEVTFNAHGLASGLYLYRLQTGNLVETKVMTLLK